jgi:hypothetical protein
MEGLFVRIAAPAALVCGLFAAGAPASAAVAGVPDAQSALSAVQQTAAAVAAPDLAPVTPAIRESPAASAPAPAARAETARPLAARPAPASAPAPRPPSAKPRPAHLRTPGPSRAPHAAAHRPGLDQRGGGKVARARAHVRRGRAPGPSGSHPSRAPLRDRTPPGRPGAMGASTGTGPGPHAFTAALLVALLTTLLPRFLRPFGGLRLPPHRVAFVSALDRPG